MTLSDPACSLLEELHRAWPEHGGLDRTSPGVVGGDGNVTRLERYGFVAGRPGDREGARGRIEDSGLGLVGLPVLEVVLVVVLAWNRKEIAVWHQRREC